MLHYVVTFQKATLNVERWQHHAIKNNIALCCHMETKSFKKIVEKKIVFWVF